MTTRQERIAANAAANHENALAVFISRKASIDAMIERLQNLSADHFNVSPESVTWANAGSLSRVEELLNDACTFINA